MFARRSKEQEEKEVALMAARNQEFQALTHEVFKNSEKGARWLDMVRDSFLFKEPTADPLRDEKVAYFREGMNTFIRNIYLTIELSEAAAKREAAGAK